MSEEPKKVQTLEARWQRVLHYLDVLSNTSGRFERRVVGAIRAKLHAEVDAACDRLRLDNGAGQVSLAEVLAAHKKAAEEPSGLESVVDEVAGT